MKSDLEAADFDHVNHTTQKSLGPKKTIAPVLRIFGDMGFPCSLLLRCTGWALDSRGLAEHLVIWLVGSCAVQLTDC